MHGRHPVALTLAGALALAGTWGLVPSVAQAAAASPAVRSVKVGSVTASTVSLSWTNPAKARSTVVRVAKGTAAPKTARSGTAVATVKAPKHAVTATRLTAETTYSFALFSTDAHGHLGRAAVAHAVTAPAAVGKTHASSTETTATVSWTNPAAATFSTVVVRYAKGTVAPRTPTTGTAARTTSAKAASVVIAGLAAGTTYSAGIWIRDSHAHYSAPVDVRVATVPLPGAVSTLTWAIQAPNAVLHWTNPTTASFTGVRVCRVDGSADTAPDPRTCTVVSDLGKVSTVTDPIAVDASVTYWVFAHDDFGHYAAGVSVNAIGPPDAVTNAAGRAYNSTTALLTWSARSGTDVRICRTAAGAEAPRLGKCDGPHLFVAFKGPYSDGTALPGQAYDYYLYATGGQGQFSLPVKVSVTMTTPAGATVEGTVTAADAPDGVSAIHVSLIAPNGRAVSDSDGDGVLDSDVLATTTTHADGTYAFTHATTNTNGLTPSNVGAFVCFDATGSTGYHQTGYASLCHGAALWGTDLEHPAGTAVSLTAGGIDTVDAALTYGGGITGFVTTAVKQATFGAEVDVFSTTTAQQTYVQAGADGNYQITGLNPGTYNVCYSAPSSKSAVTGLAPQCYRGAVVGTAAHATTVQVAAGVLTHNANDTVGAGGVITGTVDDKTTTTLLPDVDVYAFDSRGELVGYANTLGSGGYTLSGLPTGIPLTVCVDGEYSTGNSSNPGYDAECYEGAAWDVEDVPGPATAITVTPGAKRFVDFHLSLTGGVAGTVTNTSNNHIGNVGVRVFGSTTNSAGHPLEWDAVTDSGGNYLVGGLPAGTYRVCFDAGSTGAPALGDPGYVSVCDGGQAWNGGAPAGDTVTVTDGTSTPLPAVLERAGGISGLANSADGSPLTDVTVSAFTTTGDLAGTARSGYDGSYALTSLPAGSYLLCWSGSLSVDTSAPSGYSSGCAGSNGPWAGGAPAADATEVAVQSGQLTTHDLSLTAVGPGAPAVTARRGPVASHRIGLPITAARRLAVAGTRHLAR